MDFFKLHIQLLIDAGAVPHLVEFLKSSEDENKKCHAIVRILLIILCGSEEQKHAMMACNITSHLPMCLRTTKRELQNFAVNSSTNTVLLQQVFLSLTLEGLKTEIEGKVSKKVVAADFIQPFCTKLKELSGSEQVIVSFLLKFPHFQRNFL